MKYGKYFTFNGKSSKDFNVVIVTFDSSDKDLSTGLSREIISGEQNKYRFRPNHFGMKYEENLSFSIAMIKDQCNMKPGESPYFTRREAREINSWLTSVSYPILFHMFDEDYSISDEEVDYNGVFSNVEYETYDDMKVVGITATFTNDSPFAYSLPIEKTVSASFVEPYEFVIENNSDELENPLYPIFKITSTTPWTDVVIENKTEGRSITIANITPTTPLYIDTEKMIIKYLNTDEMVQLYKHEINDISDLYWPRLISGENIIKVTGNVEITIQYRELRKVGAY